MLVDLVQVDTPEGIKLSGAYFAPADVSRASSIEAFMYFHGDGGHFYNPLYLWLASGLRSEALPSWQPTAGATTTWPAARGEGPWPATPSSPCTTPAPTTRLGWSFCGRGATGA